MKYKILKQFSVIGILLTACTTIYFFASAFISTYTAIGNKKDVFNDITFQLLKPFNFLTSNIAYTVATFILAFMSVIFCRICHIIKSYCSYNLIEERNELFHKKHPTSLAKIKAMYPDDKEKWKAFARGELVENNGINIYHPKLAKYNVESRIEREVKFTHMVKDFVFKDFFSKPEYRRDTFPNHRSYEEYLRDAQEEREELDELRR